MAYYYDRVSRKFSYGCCERGDDSGLVKGPSCEETVVYVAATADGVCGLEEDKVCDPITKAAGAAEGKD